jgi:hypothetical protein
MDIDKIRKKRKEQQRQREKAQAEADRQNTAKELKGAVEDNMAMGAKSSARVTNAVKDSTDKLSEELKNNSQTLLNSLASQNNSVADALNNLVVATVMARDPKLLELISDFTSILESLANATDKLEKNPLNELPAVNKDLVKALQDFSKKESNEKDYTAKFDALESAVKALDIKPVVNIPKSDNKLNLEPLITAVNDVQSAVKANKVKVPDVNFDDVVAGLQAVQNTIANLSFPVPNYVLPFKDANGRAAQVQLDASGNMPINATIQTGDIEIGAVEIKNDVDDTRLKVVAADSVAGATDTGIAQLAIRDDILTTLTPTDGDYAPLRVDQYGAQWVSLATKLNSTDDSVSALVTNVTAGTNTTDLGKAEDAAHTSGDTGVFALGVRNDALAARTSTDGDYSPISVDSTGALIPPSATATLADGFSNTSIRFPASQSAAVMKQWAINHAFNGTSWDRMRNNEEATLLASASRTTTQTGADITNYQGNSSLIVVLDMTVVGTGSVTLTIEGKDTASGKYYTILAGAAVITNVTNRYRVSPNLTAAANSIAQDILPRVFRINVTANNANAATYSVGYCLIRG